MRKFARCLDGLFRAYCLYPLAELNQKRSISPKLRVLRAESRRDFAERKQHARRMLGDILVHAGATVPYYEELFKKLNFRPEKVASDIRYLEDLPWLTKEILREQGKNLVSRPYLEKIAREQKTGSSTGPAAIIYYDQEGLDWTAAQNILMLEQGGKRRYFREAHLSTRFASMPPGHGGRKEFALNRYNIYTRGFDDASQEELLADLQSAQARVVQGHPSSMYAFARYTRRKGINARGLFEIFVSTGEMITDEQRKLIEDELGVLVSDRYGACEFGVMGQEQANGPKCEMLISDSLVWPECADVNGEGIGELVFTNLRNRVMPLIRYRMGDLGKLEERRDGWWISRMTGRTHDSVRIDGKDYPTHYIQDILDRCGKIDDFQIVVGPAGEARELRLVSPENDWDAIQGAVAANFPSVPLKRINLEDLVFTGIRGKFSYLLRESA